MEDIFNAEHGIYLNDINLGEGTFVDQLGTITCLDELGDPIVLNLVDECADQPVEDYYDSSLDDSDYPVEFDSSVCNVTYRGETVDFVETEDGYLEANGTDWKIYVDFTEEGEGAGYLFASIYYDSDPVIQQPLNFSESIKKLQKKLSK